MENYHRTICIPLEVQQELYAYCERHGLKKGWLAGEAIREHLRRLKRRDAKKESENVHE